ncbi:---NA---, partial [Paramuricea clavata]
ELVRKYPVCVDISTQTKNDDQKLCNNNAGQFCMSENAYVNLLNKVAEVRNDTAHSISQPRINKNVNANSSKHLVACPFLLKKGHCLKGSRCDFSHNISQSRLSKKASVNPPKEVNHTFRSRYNPEAPHQQFHKNKYNNRCIRKGQNFKRPVIHRNNPITPHFRWYQTNYHPPLRSERLTQSLEWETYSDFVHQMTTPYMHGRQKLTQFSNRKFSDHLPDQG